MKNGETVQEVRLKYEKKTYEYMKEWTVRLSQMTHRTKADMTGKV